MYTAPTRRASLTRRRIWISTISRVVNLLSNDRGEGLDDLEDSVTAVMFFSDCAGPSGRHHLLFHAARRFARDVWIAVDSQPAFERDNAIGVKRARPVRKPTYQLADDWGGYGGTGTGCLVAIRWNVWSGPELLWKRKGPDVAAVQGLLLQNREFSADPREKQLLFDNGPSPTKRSLAITRRCTKSG